MDKQQAQALTLLFGAYGKTGQEEQMKIYARMLRDITANDLTMTVTKLIDTSKYLPSIAEIKETYKSLANLRNGNTQKSWDEAWYEIEHKARCLPMNVAPQWSTQEIAQTVKTIGWRILVMSDEKQKNTIRAQMRDFYKMICERKKANEENERYLAIGGYKQIGQSK